MHLNGGRGRPMKRLSVQEESAEILRLKEVRKEENLGIFQKSTRENLSSEIWLDTVVFRKTLIYLKILRGFFLDEFYENGKYGNNFDTWRISNTLEIDLPIYRIEEGKS